MKTADIEVGKEYAVTTYGNASSRYTNFDRARVEETGVERSVRGSGYLRTRQTANDGVRVTLLDEKTGRSWRGLRDGPERVLRPAQIAHLWEAEIESRKRQERAKRERDVEKATLAARMKSIVEDLGELGIGDVDWASHRFSGVYLDLGEVATFQLEAVLRAIVGDRDGLGAGSVRILREALAEIAAEAKPEEEE